jgi:hypothetical protein
MDYLSTVALDQRPSYRGGVGYLEPESVEVLGGSVKSLEPAHMATLHRGFGARIIEELCLAKVSGPKTPFGLTSSSQRPTSV